MGLGYVEGVTHDYIRHGTTTLFAPLDVATGEVISQCKPRHRHQEFLGLLRQIETSVPEDLDVYLIVDHYYTRISMPWRGPGAVTGQCVTIPRSRTF